MRQLKVLELFSGTRSVGKAFERRGHIVYSIDWDEQFYADWHVDLEKVTAAQIIKRFGHPDVIHASPDCSTYSVAAIGRHRLKDPEIPGLQPTTEYAKKCERVNVNVMRLIRDLRPKLFFIENPRGGMRKAAWIQWAPMHTVTYCHYQPELPVSERRMKPTDLWTNHPNPKFKPPCKNGDPCHAKAPRGSRTGTQGMDKVDKYVIPQALCDHIVRISEDYIERLDGANDWLIQYGREPLCPIWDDQIVIEQEPQQRLF